ncbi:MAG: hypothetical protein E7395_07355 [Ruminococcaceae bacterium]|nr:hypothetical protein [Oscillospiraceae bacterium]
MSFFMIIFLVLLIYVAYFKVEFLLFSGKQHNRIFATAVNTIIPIVGSVPAFIMASKYERRVKNIFARYDDYILRCTIIGLHLLSAFLIFLPFFSTGDIRATGVNVIYGLSRGGESVFRQAEFLVYLIYLPIVASIVSAIDTKLNVRNVISYVCAIVQALTVFALALYAETIEGLSSTFFLWFYCIIQVVIMLASFYSLVNVRNAFLLDLEKKEADGTFDILAESDKAEEMKIAQPSNTYKCSRCGKQVVKGTICSCRQSGASNGNVVAGDSLPNMGFCSRCGRKLLPDGVCACMQDAAKTENPTMMEERKCRYCGQILVGDSTCVCEKIMKNSSPTGDDASRSRHLPKYDAVNASAAKVSTELSDLEKMIEERFSRVKSSLADSDSNN